MESGRELDALVAEKVMGIKVHTFDQFGQEKYGIEVGGKTYPLAHFSTDLTAAWAIVEKFGADLIVGQHTTIAVIFKRRESGSPKPFRAYSEGPFHTPRAICLAALEMVKEA